MTYITKESALQAITDYQGGAVDKTVAKEIIFGLTDAWIPMSEREPEFGNYLTTFRKKGDPEDKRDVTIDLYWSGGWDDDGDEYETIAWMPLPEVYKEECNG